MSGYAAGHSHAFRVSNRRADLRAAIDDRDLLRRIHSEAIALPNAPMAHVLMVARQVKDAEARVVAAVFAYMDAVAAMNAAAEAKPEEPAR